MPNHGLAFAHVIARSSATCGAGVDLVSAVLFTGVSSSCKVGNLKLFNLSVLILAAVKLSCAATTASASPASYATLYAFLAVSSSDFAPFLACSSRAV